ncbi:hypothetical protein TCE0_024f07667 [Talaromyces pinophilus]|uniref:Uncharacterized protein n=1 Tax=Talaromyces pinophilus TaxID=128442 RepID=A0A6V8HBF4_TALPI|nr:hypothetical protein TCE0_024f07667 [Talaromyces pinophilus]
MHGSPPLGVFVKSGRLDWAKSFDEDLPRPQAVWDDESPDEDWYLDGKGQPITNPHRLSVALKNNDKDGRPTLPTIQGNMRYGHFSAYKMKVQVKKLGESIGNQGYNTEYDTFLAWLGPAILYMLQERPEYISTTIIYIPIAKVPLDSREEFEYQMWHREAAKEYVSETKKDMKIAAPNASVYKRSKDKRDFAASTIPLRKLAMANFATKLARLNTIMEAIGDDTHVATLRLWRAKGMDATMIQQITRDKGERLAATGLGHLFTSYLPGDTRVSNWHYAGVDVQMTIRQATRASQEKPADQHGLNKIGPGFSDDDSGLELEGDSQDAWWEGYIDSTTQIQGGSWVHIGRSIHIAYLQFPQKVIDTMKGYTEAMEKQQLPHSKEWTGHDLNNELFMRI